MGSGKKYSIGRDKSCDVPIADGSVSRLHAELTVGDGGQLVAPPAVKPTGTFPFPK